MASKAKAKGLRVTAPLVEVSLGDRRAQFRFGDFLPEGVSEESVKHLESLDYVEKVDAPSDPEGE